MSATAVSGPGTSSLSVSQAEHAAKRTGLHLMLVGGVTTALWVYAAAEERIRGWNLMPSEDLIYQVLSGIGLLLIGAFLWRTPRLARHRAWLSLSALFFGTIFVSFLVTALPIGTRPELMLLLMVTVIMLSRSAMVPCRAAESAVLALLLAVPLLVSTHLVYRGYVPPPDPRYVAFTSNAVTMFIAFWWLLISAIGVMFSNVLYGLRRQVSAAMQLGQYQLEEKLGEGGMGQVFRASHAHLRRRTAIKFLHPGWSPENQKRFESEVQMTAELSHPNIVTVFDYGETDEGVWYYAMELLDGLTLDELLDVDGPQDPSRVAYILERVANALHEAHRVKLIHRDIKPGNIMLTRQGSREDVVKVLDFGLVKQLQDTEPADLTQANMIVGTPHYLAPESIRESGQTDEQSDLYALSAVGYALLTGRPVFEGKGTVEVCSHHLHTAPKPPSEVREEAIPEKLEELILQGLQKDPAQRPASAKIFGQELADAELSKPWTQARAVQWWSENEETIRRYRKRATPE